MSTNNPNRPTVPEAAEALRAYYQRPRCDMGGIVHIIVEDGNTEQSHANWCLAQAEDHGDTEDIRIALMLASMSRTQRTKLSHMSFYP